MYANIVGVSLIFGLICFDSGYPLFLQALQHHVYSYVIFQPAACRKPGGGKTEFNNDECKFNRLFLSVLSWRICEAESALLYSSIFFPVLHPLLEQTREPLEFPPLGHGGMAPDWWKAWVCTHVMSVLPFVWDPQADTRVVQGMDQNRKKKWSEIQKYEFCFSNLWSSTDLFSFLLVQTWFLTEQDDPASLTVAQWARAFQCPPSLRR